MSKISKILGIVFHRMVFLGVFLVYTALVVIDTLFFPSPPTFGISWFAPVVIFGLVGHFVDERLSRDK
jgi:hypothetical protein